MMSSVCLLCFKPNGCRKPNCAFRTQPWKAPLTSLEKASSLKPDTGHVVVDNEDIFQMMDFDRGWDLDVGVF